MVKKDIAVLWSIYDRTQDGSIDYIINIRDGYRRAVINFDEERLFDIDENFVGQKTEHTYQKYVRVDFFWQVKITRIIFNKTSGRLFYLSFLLRGFPIN